MYKIFNKVKLTHFIVLRKMRAKKVKGISTFFSEKTAARLRHTALEILRQFYIKTNNQLIQKSLIYNAL